MNSLHKRMMCHIPIQCYCLFIATDSGISMMVVNRNMVYYRILIHTLSWVPSMGGAYQGLTACLKHLQCYSRTSGIQLWGHAIRRLDYKQFN